MALRWEDERYVRLYTRDTPEWVALSGPARGLFCLILRSVDRAGILPLGKKGPEGLAVLLRWPWEQMSDLLDELEADGCIQIVDNTLMVPNFIEAQEVPISSAQRKRDQRERARVRVKSGAFEVVGHAESRDVTRGHAESRAVTMCHSDPCLSEPNQTELRKELSDGVATGRFIKAEVNGVGFELEPDEPPPPTKPRKRKDTPPPEPLPFKPDEAVGMLATASNGRFVVSTLSQGQSIFVTKLIRKHGDPETWLQVGAWIGRGGDGWKGALDVRSIGDFEVWLGHARNPADGARQYKNLSTPRQHVDETKDVDL